MVSKDREKTARAQDRGPGSQEPKMQTLAQDRSRSTSGEGLQSLSNKLASSPSDTRGLGDNGPRKSNPHNSIIKIPVPTKPSSSSTSNSQLLRKTSSGILKDKKDKDKDKPESSTKSRGAASQSRAGANRGLKGSGSYISQSRSPQQNPPTLYPVSSSKNLRKSDDKKTVRRQFPQGATIHLHRDANEEIKIQECDEKHKRGGVPVTEASQREKSQQRSTKSLLTPSTVPKEPLEHSPISNPPAAQKKRSPKVEIAIEERPTVAKIQKEQEPIEPDDTQIENIEESSTRRVVTVEDEAKSDAECESSPFFNHKQNLINTIKESIQLETIPQSHNFYLFTQKVGSGAFGKVYSAVSILTGETVAIKCLDRKTIKNRAARDKVQREIDIHRRMDHPNVIKLFEVFENEQYIFFVMEFADKGDLLAQIRKTGVLKESAARGIVSQIILGLESCHAKRVLHRDIKLDNILLTNDGCAKLCDFGVSLLMEEGRLAFDQSGTPAYIAPELLRGHGYSGFKADVWNLGITLFTMLTGTIPFQSIDVAQLHELILEGKFNFPEKPELTPQVKDLIRRILVLEPTDRLSLDEVKRHPWFPAGTFTSLETRPSLSDDSTTRKTIIQEIETYGFPRKYIEASIREKTPNHILACYNMLLYKANRNALEAYLK